ncbi:MAG: Hpt domain-containing protein [Nitrospira sp.]|nr:Hpt domain-containing protein [Nitrospira sp.]
MQNSQPESPNRLIVRIDRDFEDIVPIFLANRHKDVQILQRALADADFTTIQMLGHRMKGDGGGYGFHRISEIGAAMEQAAEQQDNPVCAQQLAQLEEFLALVEVVYV